MKSYLSLIPISAKGAKETEPHDDAVYYYFGTAGYRDFSMADMGIRMEKKARDRRAWQLGIIMLKEPN